MAANKPSAALAAVGYLTVLDYEPHGLFGGYLVLNTSGRPLEFHCTTPVRPNRAQQILYGPTLEPYLYGEQIGRTLVEKAKVQPPVVLTDVLPALALREQVNALVAALVSSDRISDATTTTLTFTLGSHSFRVADGHAADAPELKRLLADTAMRFDLAEPFQRIREAINEAHKAA